MDANEAWRRTGSRLINVPLNEFTKNMRNDPNYISFVTSLEPVRKEFMSFLNANRAEHEADLKVMQTVLDDTQTPANIEVALKQLGKSADIRLAAIGRKYENTMHQSFPDLISPDGQATLKKMGLISKVASTQEQNAAKTFKAADGTTYNTDANGVFSAHGAQYKVAPDARHIR